MAQGLQLTLVVFSLVLYISFCCECNRSDQTKLSKKHEDVENLVMEMEIEASTKPELKIAEGELTSNSETILKFKRDVARFLVTSEKLDKNLVDPPAPPCFIE